VNAAENGEVLVTARLLRAAGRIDWLGTGITLLAATGLLLAKASVPLMTITVLLGIAAKVYFVRIVFDARLFEDAAAKRIATEELDGALAKVGGAKGSAGERPWSDRCRGARRLVVVGASLTIVQCVAFLVGMVLR